MSHNDSSSLNRRQFLQNATIAASAVTATPAVAAAKSHPNSSMPVDTSFRPANTDEVRRFLKRLNKQPEKTHNDVFNALSPKKQQAVTDFLKITDLKIEGFVEEDNLESAGFDGYITKIVTGYVGGENNSGDTIWGFRQRLTYKWHYNVDVKIVDAVVSPSTNYPFWGYGGTVASDRVDSGTYADSYKKGEFNYCVTTYGCIQNKYPFIEMRCYSKAGWRYEKRGVGNICRGHDC